MSAPPPGKGSHWVFMYFIDQDNLLYINSFGTGCDYLERIVKDLKKNIYVSTATVQSDGNSCGPIATELAMHFQGEYFLKKGDLLKHLQEKIKGKSGYVKKVKTEDLFPQNVKDCRCGNSHAIRKQHKNKYIESGGENLGIIYWLTTGLLIESFEDRNQYLQMPGNERRQYFESVFKEKYKDLYNRDSLSQEGQFLSFSLENCIKIYKYFFSDNNLSLAEEDECQIAAIDNILKSIEKQDIKDEELVEELVKSLKGLKKRYEGAKSKSFPAILERAHQQVREIEECYNQHSTQ